MLKVAFCSPNENSAELKKRFEKQMPEQVAVWGDVLAVTENENPDYFVCLQDDNDFTKNIEDEKKIYVQREPSAVVPFEDYAKNKVHVHSYLNSFHFATWWVDASYDDLLEMPFPEKTKDVHVILSHKRDTHGHKTRTNFVLDYIKVHGNVIDIFGTFKNVYKSLGWARVNPVLEKLFSVYNRLTRKKQPYDFDKLEIARPYKYQLVMENSIEENYFTEKIVDAYLAWSMPIYWGCPNLSDYFPKDSYYAIDIEDPRAIEKLYQLSSKPLTQKNIAAIAEARQLILDKYNIWPALETFIKKEVLQ